MSNWPLFIADLTDPSAQTRLLDFNSSESGTGRLLVDADTFSLGGADFDETWLSAEGVDDAVLASARRPPARMEFDLHYIKRSDVDTAANLQTEIRILNQALNMPGLIVTTPPGYDTLYIDYLRSPLTTPFIPGPRRLYQLFATLTSPDGLHVVINRLSKMRGALLEASVNKCRNATLAEDHDGDGIPSLWAWDSATGLSQHDFSWTYAAYRFVHATTSTRLFRQTISPASATQVWTFAFEAASTHSGTAATVRARIEFLDGASAVIGSATDGTTPTIVLSPSVGFSVAKVTATAPTGTASVRVSVLVSNSTTDANTIYVRKLQAEIAAAPTRFRVGVETVTNDLRNAFGKRLWIWGDGNTDGLVQMTAAPASGANIVRMRMARRSGFRNSHSSMQTFPGIRGVDAIPKSGSVSATDAAATGGNALQTSVGPVYKVVVRAEFPQADDTALRGRWHVHAAIRFPLTWIGNVQGRYGLADVADLPRPMTDWPIDMTEPTVSEYVSFDFGIVDIPAGADGLFFEIWIRRTGGSGSPLIDVIWPMPADDASSTTLVPGHDDPGQVATEKWLPVDLVTPPLHPLGLDAGFISLADNDMVLNDTDQAAEIPEDATADLTPGVVHTFTVGGVMYNPGLTALQHGDLKVFDVTTLAQITKAAITAPKGSTWPAYTVSVKFTPVAGHAYAIYVRQSIPNAQGNIHIRTWSHSFVPPVVGGIDEIVLDGALRQAYVTESGLRTSDLDHIPPFPATEPGLQLLRISTTDEPGSGYDQASAEDLTKHVPGVTLDVAFDQIPRWTN